MAAPTMTRAPPPRLPDAEHPLITSPPPSPTPPPPPLPEAPPKNPWRINTYGGAAPPAATSATPAAAVTLMGEPSSSWPPLSSSQRQRQSESPPLLSPPSEIHPETAGGSEDQIPPPDPSSPFQELPPPPVTAEPAAAAAAAASTPTVFPSPPAPAPALPPPTMVLSGNAAAVEAPRSPRPLLSPQRRGARNPRWNYPRGGHRGGAASSSSNNHNHNHNGYGNRSPAPPPGWRPNWSFSSPPPPPPQYQPWGFYPASAVGVVPPVELSQIFVQYPQPYGELVYPDYGADHFVPAPYFDPTAYEMPYVPPPLNPENPATPTSPVIAPSFPVVAARDPQAELKQALLTQIEYYFSEENLNKDSFLKNMMDGEGWVPISTIATFRRVAAKTEDIDLIKEALRSSNIVEFQGNRMRRRNDWHRWVPQVAAQNLLLGMQGVNLAE